LGDSIVNPIDLANSVVWGDAVVSDPTLPLGSTANKAPGPPGGSN